MKRIASLDIAKGIGILLVLLGHLLENGSVMKAMIYSFHMPLFFMISGAVMKEENWKLRLHKRFYSILIPYILWAFIFSGFSWQKAAYILYGTNETLLKAGSNGMLWFLATMFIASIAGGADYSVKEPFQMLSIACGWCGLFNGCL